MTIPKLVTMNGNGSETIHEKYEVATAKKDVTQDVIEVVKYPKIVARFSIGLDTLDPLSTKLLYYLA